MSQATADVLSACGKSAWLAPRKDKVVAKGLGELSTFFVTLSTSTGSMTSGGVSTQDAISTDGTSVDGATMNGDTVVEV